MANELNLDHDDARTLHRVVRAMHDGECPKCHCVHGSDEMRFSRLGPTPFPGSPAPVLESGWRCPTCSFQITDEEAAEVFAIFAPFMERNLAIFEGWRASRLSTVSPLDEASVKKLMAAPEWQKNCLNKVQGDLP